MNQKIAALIITYPEFDYASIINNINIKSIVVKDSTLYNYKSFVDVFGPAFTTSILAELKAAAASNILIEAGYNSFIGAGLDFSNSVVQGMITQLGQAGVFQPSEVATMLSIGIKKFSIVDQQFSGVSPTVQDFIDTKTQMDYIANVQVWWNNLHNTIIPQIEQGTITKEQIQALVAQ